MSSSLPTFVVVGHVNKGKSSVVSTLIEDATIPIDNAPGTTRRAGTYQLSIRGTPVLQVVDTPGFHEAPAALEWMQARSTGAEDRAATVAAFVAEFDGSGRFEDECELLGRLAEDAGLLYVVDGSRPYVPAYEAEMEILRWTGCPGMALLNRVRPDDHGQAWRGVLGQFFHIVREFNAHRAGFPERMRLLRGFAELREAWRGPIERAVSVLESEHDQRQRRALLAVVDQLVGSLLHVERRRITDEADEGADERLVEAFRAELRAREQRTRQSVERLYRHERLQRASEELQVLDEDLFSETSWRLFGLQKGQLLRSAALWGAALGAATGLVVGGPPGTLVGGAGGGLGGGLLALLGSRTLSRFYSEQSPLFRRLFPGDTGPYRCFGPVASPTFAWLLLDRALSHCAAVRDRAHARRDELRLPAPGEKAGLAARLPRGVRDDLDRLLRRVLRARSPDRLEDGLREELADALARSLEAGSGGGCEPSSGPADGPDPDDASVTGT